MVVQAQWVGSKHPISTCIVCSAVYRVEDGGEKFLCAECQAERDRETCGQ